MHGPLMKSNVTIPLVLQVIVLINNKHRMFKIFCFIPVKECDKSSKAADSDILCGCAQFLHANIGIGSDTTN